MFCSKCGTELNNEGVCENCGQKTSTGKGRYVSQHRNYSVKIPTVLLLVLLVIEWVLVSCSAVEVGSEFLGITKEFGYFEVLKSDYAQTVIHLMHFASVIVLLWELVGQQKKKAWCFLPAIVTSCTVTVMSIRLVLKLDALVSDTILGELAYYTNIDIKLSATAILLIIVSIVSVLYAACAVWKMGKPVMNPYGNAKVNEARRKVTFKEALHISKRDFREAIIVLVVLCLAASASLAIPAVIRSFLPNTIVDSWYMEGAEKGDDPYITFYSDNTCEIAGYYGKNKWNIEDGNLRITTYYGERFDCSYEWEGNNLVINGVTFTRNPG